MYCKNCGEALNENQDICLNCGAKKETGNKFCQNCGKETNENAAVCLSCGTQLKKPQAKEADTKTNDAGSPLPLVLGICAFILCFIPFLPSIIPLILSIVSLIISVKAIKNNKSSTFAIIGIVFSSLALAISIIPTITAGIILALFIFWILLYVIMVIVVIVIYVIVIIFMLIGFILSGGAL